MIKTINEFLEDEYKEYAETVSFKRALPSLVDGFRPVRRKIFFYMKLNKNNMIRVSSIAGGIAERCNYHHGEASAVSTIINMAKIFPSSNNYPILIPKGSFGSKVLPKSAAAGRYIHAQYNLMNDYIFLDNNLLQKNEEFDSPEPAFYLPIIPLFAVNGISGIGIGYACNILPRKITDVINSVKEVIQNKEVSEVLPHFNHCQYIIKKLSNTSFLITGQYKITNNKVSITEFIPTADREKIIENLIALQDSGIVKSYKDESKDNFKFQVEFTKEHPEDKIVSYLNLSKQFHENYTLLDENNKIIVFSAYEEMIKYFTNHRLSYYTKRKQAEIKRLQKEIKRVEAIKLFIFNLKIISDMSEKEIKLYFKDKIEEDLIDYCLKQPLNWFLKKNINECNLSIKNYEDDIQYFEGVAETKLYLNDLKELEKALERCKL